MRPAGSESNNEGIGFESLSRPVAGDNIGASLKGVSNPRNINIKEVTHPGSQNPVKVYTDGYAQVNKGKIDTYIRVKLRNQKIILN